MARYRSATAVPRKPSTQLSIDIQQEGERRKALKQSGLAREDATGSIREEELPFPAHHGRMVGRTVDLALFPGSKQQLEGELRADRRRVRERGGLLGFLHGVETENQLG